MIDPTPEPRELTRLREQVERCSKRRLRVAEKARANEVEGADADRCFDAAHDALSAYLAANPLPQIEMAL